MKKLALCLLFSSLALQNSYNSVETNMGPLQLTTTNGDNAFAAGTVKLFGAIEIGQTSTDQIKMQGADIAQGTNIGNTNIATVMSIDSTGQIVSGPLIMLGSGGNNQIVCNTSASLDILATSGNLNLNSSTNQIILSGANIQNPVNLNTMIGLTPSGAVVTSENIIRPFVMGIKDDVAPANNEAFLMVDNTSNGTTFTGAGIELNIATMNAANTVAKILLDAGGSRDIHLISKSITAPTTNDTALAIGLNGEIVSSNRDSLFIFGNNGGSKNYISVGNESATATGIKLSTADAGESILLDSGSNNIMLISGKIIPAAPGDSNVLVALTPVNNEMISTNNADEFVIGIKDNATAANSEAYIAINNTVTTGNGILLSVANVNASNTTAKIILDAGLSRDIELKSQQIITPSTGEHNVLALDENNNIETSSATKKYILGDSSNVASKNAIVVDNATYANGISVLGSSVHFDGQNLAPASGTNMLTIDANGKLGIQVSTEKEKDNIAPLYISDESLAQLMPVSYNYKEFPDKVDFGFIAERIAEIPELASNVIYDQNGDCMSLDYKGVFVAVIANYKETKKALENKIASLEEKMVLKDEEIQKLEERISMLESFYTALAEKYIESME